jgi:broad specificity phosphatase PhoE
MAGSELWLVRHGETAWSRSGRHTSTTDLDLLDEGVRAAAALADRLAGERFDLVLTSPLLRARRTAGLTGFPDAVVDADLAEWRYGDYEGRTTAEIRTDVPGWSIWTHPAPGGESAGEVAARLDRVVARARGHDRVLAFSHGHALRALAARWVGLHATDGRLLTLGTASLSVLGFERETPVIRRWNA